MYPQFNLTNPMNMHSHKFQFSVSSSVRRLKINSHFLMFYKYFRVLRQVLSKQDIITAPTDSRFQIDVEKNWTESSKTSALMRELEALRLTKEKSVVFSQWTAFLDLLEIPLKRYILFSPYLVNQ